MLPVDAILALFVAHFYGDFVLQSDIMARGKAHCRALLTGHVIAYSGVLALLLWPFLGWTIVAFVLLNGGLHWLTDRVTAPINARLWAEGRTHDFFVGVGLDQTIHLVTLILTLKAFLA